MLKRSATVKFICLVCRRFTRFTAFGSTIMQQIFSNWLASTRKYRKSKVPALVWGPGAPLQRSDVGPLQAKYIYIYIKKKKKTNISIWRSRITAAQGIAQRRWGNERKMKCFDGTFFLKRHWATGHVQNNGPQATEIPGPWWAYVTSRAWQSSNLVMEVQCAAHETYQQIFHKSSMVPCREMKTVCW